MEKKPTHQDEAQFPHKHVGRADVKEARDRLSEQHEQSSAEYITRQWAPKNRLVRATRYEQRPDGTPVAVEYQKREPHPGIDPKEIQRALLGKEELTRADSAALDAYAGGSDALNALYDQAKQDILDGLSTENLDPFFDALARLGPRLLRDPELNTLVEGWWLALLDPAVSRERQAAARENLERIGMVWGSIGKGNRESLSPEEKETIIADCKKWYPICRGLNKDFKELRKIPEYEASDLFRKEARGKLAEKHNVSIADVSSIEALLYKSSRQARKTTLLDAMTHWVARKHPMRGQKTIENIWGAYRKAEKK